MTGSDSKTCNKCGEVKPRTEFNQKQGQCKPCQREYLREYQRTWRAENPDKERAKQDRYRNGSSREKYLANKRRQNALHKDKRAEEWAKYYAANGDQVRAARAAKYDPEKKRATRDRVKDREYYRQYRARLLEAFVAPVVEEDIILRDEGYCGICGKPIMERTLEIDHVIPLVAGGTHEPDNVQLAHRSCNRRKWAKVEFTLA